MFFRTKPLALALAVLCFSITACGKKVGGEKIAEEVVGAMCKKIVSCQPNLMPSADFCKQTVKTGLLQAKKDLLKIESTQKQLDACLNSINNMSCENMLGAKPPEGCDFLN